MEYFFFKVVSKVQRSNTDGSSDRMATGNADGEIIQISFVLPLVPSPELILSKVVLVLN
jgi:hypothetical protein